MTIMKPEIENTYPINYNKEDIEYYLETNLTNDEFERFKKFMYDEIDAKGSYGEDWFFGYIIPEFRKRLLKGRIRTE